MIRRVMKGAGWPQLGAASAGLTHSLCGRAQDPWTLPHRPPGRRLQTTGARKKRAFLFYDPNLPEADTSGLEDWDVRRVDVSELRTHGLPDLDLRPQDRVVLNMCGGRSALEPRLVDFRLAWDALNKPLEGIQLHQESIAVGIYSSTKNARDYCRYRGITAHPVPPGKSFSLSQLLASMPPIPEGATTLGQKVSELAPLPIDHATRLLCFAPANGTLPDEAILGVQALKIASAVAAPSIISTDPQNDHPKGNHRLLKQWLQIGGDAGGLGLVAGLGGPAQNFDLVRPYLRFLPSLPVLTQSDIATVLQSYSEQETVKRSVVWYVDHGNKNCIYTREHRDQRLIEGADRDTFEVGAITRAILPLLMAGQEVVLVLDCCCGKGVVDGILQELPKVAGDRPLPLANFGWITTQARTYGYTWKDYGEDAFSSLLSDAILSSFPLDASFQGRMEGLWGDMLRDYERYHSEIRDTTRDPLHKYPETLRDAMELSLSLPKGVVEGEWVGATTRSHMEDAFLPPFEDEAISLDFSLLEHPVFPHSLAALGLSEKDVERARGQGADVLQEMIERHQLMAALERWALEKLAENPLTTATSWDEAVDQALNAAGGCVGCSPLACSLYRREGLGFGFQQQMNLVMSWGNFEEEFCRLDFDEVRREHWE